MTAKEQVLKVYPDARCECEISTFYDDLVCSIYPTQDSEEIINHYPCHLESEAWQSALTKINENGTTSNPSTEEA